MCETQNQVGIKCSLGTLYIVDLAAPHGSLIPEGDRVVWFFGFPKSCLERLLAFKPPEEVTEQEFPKCRASSFAVKAPKSVEGKLRQLGKSYTFKEHCVSAWKPKGDTNFQNVSALMCGKFNMEVSFLRQLEKSFQI